MTHKKILTWQQLSNMFLVEENGRNIKGLSELITLTRQKGLGESVSYQKTRYSSDDLNKLEKVIRWWAYMDQSGNKEFRNKLIDKKIQEIVIDKIINNKKLKFYATYCPSYKMGTKAVGYTGKLGKHTKKMTKSFMDFVNETNKIGIKADGLLFFSDLLLENYEALKGSAYKRDLETNFNELQGFIAKNNFKKRFQCILLSEIEDFKNAIGEKGLTEGKLKVSEGNFNMVLRRNMVFYQEKLGWGLDKIKMRTKVLARCYSYMGKSFKQNKSDWIMYWTESAYERASLYQGLNQSYTLAIIFPSKKNDRT